MDWTLPRSASARPKPLLSEFNLSEAAGRLSPDERRRGARSDLLTRELASLEKKGAGGTSRDVVCEPSLLSVAS